MPAYQSLYLIAKIANRLNLSLIGSPECAHFTNSTNEKIYARCGVKVSCLNWVKVLVSI